MTRVSTVVLILALLGGTAVAFAVTERLKLEKVPVSRTQVDKVFSPTCDCDTSEAHITFVLRRPETITVDVLGSNGFVRSLASTEDVLRGRASFVWNGMDDTGAQAPDGTYRVRVELGREHRTISLPNRITLDSRRPQIVAASVGPRTLSPDGDHRSDAVRVSYRLSEPGRILLYVDGTRRVLGKFHPPAGKVGWYGLVDGKPLRAGRYRLSLVARDVAGNLGEPRQLGVVRIRYVSLPRRIVARSGSRFRVRVDTDARTVKWRLGRRAGRAGPSLALRAPERTGRYRLYVSERGHAVRATVIVRP